MTNKAMNVVADVLRANSKGLCHPHETTPAYELAVEVLRLERDLTDAKQDLRRYYAVLSLCHSTEVHEQDFVGVMLPEPKAYYPSTAQTFEAAIDEQIALHPEIATKD